MAGRGSRRAEHSLIGHPNNATCVPRLRPSRGQGNPQPPRRPLRGRLPFRRGAWHWVGGRTRSCCRCERKKKGNVARSSCPARENSGGNFSSRSKPHTTWSVTSRGMIVLVIG